MKGNVYLIRDLVAFMYITSRTKILQNVIDRKDILST